MKKMILVLMMVFLLVGTVSALTLSRNPPLNVSPSSSFTITYQTANAPNSQWFVAWEDTMSNGCTPAKFSNFMAEQTGGDKSTTKTFTAPASGSCVLSGYYQDASGPQVSFPTKTIYVGALPVSCQPLWSCSGYGSCVGGMRTQTCSDSNSCGVNTNQPALTQSCTSTNNQTNQTNNNQTGTTPPTNSSEGKYCQLVGKISFLKTPVISKCGDGTALLIIGLFVLLILIK